ncbi:MAG: hypothetical protein KKA81_17425 [Bacteroidetes bacterium]|nr:hypothetical protein [Bacteroidota bacterium]
MSFFKTNYFKGSKNWLKNVAERGNVFLLLFGAVGMVGVIGASTMTVLKGPVSVMSEVTKRTLTENQMIAAGKIALIAATQNGSGSCDSDTLVEPIEMSATTIAGFTGGSEIPTSIGVGKEDGWGMPFGYCAWDHGSEVGMGGCAAKNYRDGSDTTDQYVVAIVSAGPDGVFNTKCNDYVDATTVLLEKNPGVDDIVLGYTYAEAAAASGGLWNETTPGTAEIAKNVSIKDSGGTEQFAFDAAAGTLAVGTSGQFPSVRTDNLQAISGSIALLSNFDAVTADGAITGASLAAGAGAITGGSLDVGSGAITTTGTLNAGTSTLGATGVSSLDAGSGAITTTGTLNAGAATLGATGVSSLSASGLIRTTGNTELGDDIADSVTIAGITTIGGTLDVTGDTSVSTFDTSGLAQLESLTVTNATTLNGNVTLGDANTDVLTANANIAMSGNKITGLATPPTADDDAATKKYVDDQITTGVPGAETDPQVGTITANKWCVGNAGGTAIECTADANAETDPQVGTLTASKWCTTDGTDIDCTSDAPSGLPSGCTSGQIAQYNGSAWVCAADVDASTLTSGFRVHRNGAAQGIPRITVTTFNANTKDYDINTEFDLSTDRFTPTQAGYYHLTFGIGINDIDLNAPVQARIHKNGTEIAVQVDRADVAVSQVWAQVSTTVYLNGTGDYVTAETHHQSSQANRWTNGAANATYFEGFLVPGLGGGAGDGDTLADLSCTDGQVAKWNNGGGVWECAADNAGSGGITALTGDVTASGSGSVAATIANNAITNAKMADDAVGIAELSATGTPNSTTYLRGDNTWSTVSAGAETDPQVGAVTNSMWCRGTGTQVTCDQPAPSSSGVPSGAVMTFDLASCPSGWSPLVGAQNRFIVGSGGLYVRNSSGGANTSSLSVANLPSHIHSVDPPDTATTSAGTHSHTVNPDPASTSSNGNHSHISQFGSTGRASGGLGTMSNSSGTNVTDTSDTAGDHQHTVDIPSTTSSTDGNHPHSVNIASFSSGSTGSGSAFAIMPPYLALLYCKKD